MSDVAFRDDKVLQREIAAEALKRKSRPSSAVHQADAHWCSQPLEAELRPWKEEHHHQMPRSSQAESQSVLESLPGAGQKRPDEVMAHRQGLGPPHQTTNIISCSCNAECRCLEHIVKEGRLHYDFARRGLSIAYMNQTAEIKIQGDAAIVKWASEEINKLRNSLHKEELESRQYGMGEYFTTETMGKTQIQTIENDDQVGIEPEIIDFGVPAAESHTAANIELEVGNIAKAKEYDVLVCSTANDSNQLGKCGAIAEAFSKKGGKKLKESFSSHGGLAEGEMYRATSTGNIPCSDVIFVGVRYWKGQSSKQPLQRVIEASLKQCTDLALSSIALPTIGCGKMKYPPEVFLQCVAEVARLYPQIKITIMAYTKDDTYKVIKAAMDDSKTRYDGCNVSVTQGDIIEQQCEVLVISLGQQNPLLDNCGAVSAACGAAVGGSKLQDDFTAVAGSSNGLGMGEVAVSKLEDVLNCNRLLYMGLEEWKGQKTTELTVAGIELCLKRAKALGKTQVAFPALGTGMLEFPADEVARCFVLAARKFPAMKVTIVCKGSTVYGVMQEEVGKASKKYNRNKQRKSFGGTMSRLFGKPEDKKKTTAAPAISDEPRQCVRFTIYGKNSSTTQQAKNKLSKLVQESYREVVISAKTCAALLSSVPDTAGLIRPSNNSAHILYDEKKREVWIRGAAPAVKDMEEHCLAFLKQHDKKKADDAKPRSRTPAEWRKFPGLDRNEANLQVQRKGLKGGPEFLSSVDKRTFDQVSQMVTNTWDIAGNPQVTAVQRVENPSLYFAYMDYLQKLDSEATTGCIKSLSAVNEAEVHTATLGLRELYKDCDRDINEYLLFHGTTSTNAPGVMAQGLLTKTFANGNALFGGGTYLAEKASKAHGYTESSGCTMFIVRAALGDVYVSPERKQFERPPCKVPECNDAKCSHISFYNSVLGKHGDESKENFRYREFILYENAMCYPLYYVTYKVK